MDELQNKRSKMYCWTDGTDYLMHHGIKGQKWGVQNGPPYPLNKKTHNKVVAKESGANNIPVNKELSEQANKLYKNSVIASKAITVEQWQALDNKVNNDYVDMFNLINNKVLDVYNGEKIDSVIGKYYDKMDDSNSEYRDFRSKYYGIKSAHNGFRTKKNKLKLDELEKTKKKTEDELIIAIIKRLGLPNNNDSFDMVESCVFWD